MDQVHADDTKENNQVAEVDGDSVNTLVNESLQLFKPKILNAIEMIEIKRKSVSISVQYMITSWKLKLQTQIKPQQKT